MKKLVVIAGLVISGLFAGLAAAQTTTTEGVGNDVTLNVILNPVRTLTINQDRVDLVYTTAGDYANGVSKTISDHLTVTSIGSGFKVYAKAVTEDLVHSPSNTRLSTDAGSELVTVSVANGETRTIQNLNTQNDDGKNYGAKVLQGNATIDAKYNVTYTAAGNNAYINKIIDKNQTTYTVLITYTIDTE